MPPLQSIVAPAVVWIVAGALIGVVLTADLKVFRGFLRAHWPLAGMVLGALIGAAGAALWIFRARLPFATHVSSVKVELPLVGKLEMAMTPAERSFLWRFFVELATRVSTQRLGAHEGILREALKSLYDLYSVARAELASAPPAALPFTDISARAYVIDILNRELRPFLSRWHPLLTAWEQTKLPESAWPLAQLCRSDLDTTRQRILWLTWDLGTALNVQGLDKILPARPRDDALGELTAAEIVREHDPDLSRLDAERVKAAWRIFVECTSRIATQPLAPGTGLLREALKSLYKLFGTIRDELKTIGPTPPLAPVIAAAAPPADAAAPAVARPKAAAADTIESISFRLLNHHLRPFLAKWHPALLAWESEQPPDQKKSEVEWPDAERCRAELEQLRQDMRQDVRRLGALVGVQHLDNILN
jgi:hypothetical protein